MPRTVPSALILLFAAVSWAHPPAEAEARGPRELASRGEPSDTGLSAGQATLNRPSKPPAAPPSEPIRLPHLDPLPQEARTPETPDSPAPPNRSATPANPATAASDRESGSTTSAAPTDAPPPLATHRAARAFRKRLAALLRRAPIRGVTLGLVVADTATGQEWARYRPTRALNPASNLKLCTSATALDLLGPKHRFATTLRTDGKDLFLVGDGDPMLSSADLGALVQAATLPPTIRDVVVDASAFSGGVLPPGYGKKHTDAAYRAATGAVALDYGTVRVEVWPTRDGRPPRVGLTPQNSYVDIRNQATTVVGTGSTIRIALVPLGRRSRVVVTGRIGQRRRRPTWAVRRVEHPPLMAGAALARLLRRRHVRISGEVRLGKAPTDSALLARHRSPPLEKIVAKMNKESNNFIAEMLLRGLARRGKRVGTWRAGQRAVRRFLTHQVGLNPNAIRYRNGSGLYDGGALSARDLVMLLLFMDKHRDRAAFRGSLAVAGLNGTLAQRLKGANYQRRVIGKTGTLNEVSALSGYARNRKGRLLAFSILMNNTHKATAQMRHLQDQIAALLVDSH